MITLTAKGRETRQFSNDLAAEICLQLAGGGWTTKQTTNATIALSQLNTLGETKIGKVTVTKDAT